LGGAFWEGWLGGGIAHLVVVVFWRGWIVVVVVVVCVGVVWVGVVVRLVMVVARLGWRKAFLLAGAREAEGWWFWNLAVRALEVDNSRCLWE
jgi:hypothetical protein